MRLFALVALAALTFAGAPARLQAADPYAIDAVVSLTGPSTFVGQGTQQGLQAGERIVNRAGGIGGRPVTFVFNGGPGAASAYLHLGLTAPASLPAAQPGLFEDEV